MKAATLAVIFVLAASVPATARANEELYGTWRLLSFTRQVVDTGETANIFGKSPHGYITYGRDGRVFAIIVREDRPKPADLAKITDAERAELFKTMLAYGGTFKAEGSRVVHNVDISWNENWTGTAQVRNFRIDGNRLIISVDPQIGGDGRRITSVLTWEKVQH